MRTIESSDVKLRIRVTSAEQEGISVVCLKARFASVYESVVERSTRLDACEWPKELEKERVIEVRIARMCFA
jgi:hypothetical protein